MKKINVILLSLTLIIAASLVIVQFSAIAKTFINFNSTDGFFSFIPNILFNQPAPFHPGSYNIIANGGFEGNTGWVIPATAFSAGYSIDLAHSGSHSMRTGITDPVDNRYAYSDARQTVTIPVDATFTYLSMWIYPISGETVLGTFPEIPEESSFGDEPMVGDLQYVIILDQYGHWIDTLFWQLRDDRTWKNIHYDLSNYAGDTIMIQFGTYNDGYNGTSAMYVDDVHLDIYPYAPPSPTPTDSVPPGDCTEKIKNGGFENGTAWEIPVTAYPAAYSTTKYHSGTRSMRTGIVIADDNLYSYSSTRQTVTIPATSKNVTLRFWIYPRSDETLSIPIPQQQLGIVFEEAPLSGDVQYVLILDENNIWIDTLVWDRSDSRQWTEYSFNLKQYAGQTIKLHFGTYNDGYNGITSMYVDDVSLTICPPGTPTPTLPPTPTPNVTPTPTKTPMPANCYEEIINTGFEKNTGWGIPLTVYPAVYSPTKFHSGTRSMRTGIVAVGDNVYSFSDARQTVDIPSDSEKAKLTLWEYPMSGEVSSLALPQIQLGTTFGLAPLSGDVQYLLVLDRYDTWIDTLIWQRSDDRHWNSQTFNLLNFAGMTITLQFGTYNDGKNGISAMYVDDFSLMICRP